MLNKVLFLAFILVGVSEALIINLYKTKIQTILFSKKVIIISIKYLSYCRVSVYLNIMVEPLKLDRLVVVTIVYMLEVCRIIVQTIESSNI